MAIEYFSPSQLAELVDRLLVLTERNALKWVQVANDEFKFGAQIKSNAFSVRSKDSDDMAPHQLSIFEVVDGKLGRELQVVDTQYTDDVELNEKIEELYQLVKRLTLKIDVVAKNILSALDEVEQETRPPF